MCSGVARVPFFGSKQLFSTILLYDLTDDRLKCQKLYEVYSDRPILLHYLKKLWVIYVKDVQQDQPLMELVLMIAEQSDLQELHFASRHPMPTFNHKLPPGMREAMFELVQTPSLHTIIINSWCQCSIPIDYIVTSQKLKHLALVNQDTTHRLEARLPDAESILSSPRHLESLDIDGQTCRNIARYLTAPQTPLYIVSIRALTVRHLTPDALHAVGTVIQVAGQKIECLIWLLLELWKFDSSSSVTGAQWYDLLNLPLLTSLRTLVILCNGLRLVDSTRICDLINACSLSRRSPHEHIAILVRYSHPEPLPSQGALDVLEAIFKTADIDQTLAKVSHGRLPPTRVSMRWLVDCSDHLDIDLDPTSSEMRSAVAKWLPLTSAKNGRVEVGIDLVSDMWSILDQLQAAALL